MGNKAPIWETYVAALFMGGLIGSILTLTFWEWRYVLVLVALVLGGAIGGLKLSMILDHHHVDIEAKRNRAKLIHATDQAQLYVHEGKVESYGNIPRPAGTRSAIPSDEQLRPVPGSGPPPNPNVPAPLYFPTTFAELVNGGYIEPGRDFVLGFDEGSGEAITMPELTSLGIGGGQGTGKTVSTLNIAMQAIIKYEGRVRFIVSDPHMYVQNDQPLMSKMQPLIPFFLTLDEVRETLPDEDGEYHTLLDRMEQELVTNPTEGGADLKLWTDLVRLEMDRRLHGKEGEKWVIIIDEFAAVMSDERSAKPVALTLERINQQARKIDMFALLVSQEWKATRTGGSELRHSIVSFIVHNMPDSIASLIVPSDVARQAPRMRVGQAILYSRGTARVGRVPYSVVGDASHVASLYQPLLNGGLAGTEPTTPLRLRGGRGRG